MKIKLKINAFNRVPGDVVDVDPLIAKRYIDCGDAVEYKRPVPEPVEDSEPEKSEPKAKAKRGTRKNLENKSLSAAG
ncbi:MAG: hypothetical protein JJ916_04215 [Phycisphaerales bacterium]|nr:hypothetical protein [Phycisphaerales bacterium]